LILSKAILEIYPDALEHVDFLIVADHVTLEQSIDYWNEDKYPMPTQEQLLEAWGHAETKMNQEKEIEELKQYLNETDFYYIRNLDIGKSVPIEVKKKRDEVRKRFVELGL
jgi:hypothetical protein